MMSSNEPQQAMSSERLAELRTFIEIVGRMIDEEWTVSGAFGDDGIAQALTDVRDINIALAKVEQLAEELEHCVADYARYREEAVAAYQSLIASEARLYDECRNALADNKRLRAREAALVAVADEIAYATLVYPDLTSGESRYLCPFCAGNDAMCTIDFVHTKSCLVTQARALLAAGEQAQDEA